MDNNMTLNGIIFDIKKYAIHDGPGIRTTVFFKGCPLDCWWCHNPEGRKPDPETLPAKTSGNDAPNSKKTETVGRVVSAETVIEEINKDIIFYDQSGGGVTFSGGEPMMQPEFLCALLQTCKQNGIHTAVDTCGYAQTEKFAEILDLVDLFLYDLKIMDDQAHIKYTGVSNELILKNLIELSRNGRRVQLRVPLIPGITDPNENLDAIAEFIAPLDNIHEIVLLPYNQLVEHKLNKFKMDHKLGHLRIQENAEIQDKVRRFALRGYQVKIGG